MSVLDKVNSPADLKKLTDEELKDLAGDIRQALLYKVSQVGATSVLIWVLQK